MAKRPDPYPSGVEAVDKMLAGALRKAGKAHGYRLTSDYLWKQEGDFFITGLAMLMNDRMCVRLSSDVKTMEADDLLWDILGFESNKDEYISLRATGAFTAPGLNIGNDDGFYKLFPFDNEDQLEEIAKAAVSHLESASQKLLASINEDTARFYELMLEQNNPIGNNALGARGQGLPRSLSLIALGDLKETIALAEYQIATGYDIFHFGVGSKGDATLIKEYCERKLAEKEENTSCLI